MAAIGNKEAFYTRYPCILFILYLNETFSKFCHLKLPVPIMQWCTQVLASQWATNTAEVYIKKSSLNPCTFQNKLKLADISPQHTYGIFMIAMIAQTLLQITGSSF